MKSAKNILVPVDFTEQSIIGLEQSYNLARLSKSEITVLHVVRDNNSVFNLFTEKEKEDVMLKLKNKLDEYAESISKRTGVKVHTLLEKGKVVEMILEVAERLDSRFIVMGTTKPDKMMKKIIGSNALRVIKEAHCPVITIEGKHHRDGCENIVLPLDLTKETNQKVSHALHFAKLFGSKIHAVSAVTTKDDYLTGRLKLQLEQVQKFIIKQGVDCTVEMLKAQPNNDSIVKTLMDYAHEVKGDLIVIMTQQENKISQYFLGSLASAIIQQSKIPVMSIVPK